MAGEAKAGDVEMLGRELLWDGFTRLYRYTLRHRRFDGGWSGVLDREVLDRGRAAAVFPYDARADRLVLVEQFRPAAWAARQPAWQIEPVGGIIDDDETAEETVRREAVEEAGVAIGALEAIGTYMPSTVGVQATVSLFCGAVDSGGAGGIHGMAGEGEETRVVLMSPEEALAAVEDGRAAAAGMQIGLLWLLLHRERLRAAWG